MPKRPVLPLLWLLCASLLARRHAKCPAKLQNASIPRARRKMSPVSQMQPLLHAVPGAAKRLNVSETTVWRLVAEKELYPTYVRGRTMISEAELQRYVADATVRPRAKKAPLADKKRTETGENRACELIHDEGIEK